MEQKFDTLEFEKRVIRDFDECTTRIDVYRNLWYYLGRADSCFKYDMLKLKEWEEIREFIELQEEEAYERVRGNDNE